MIPVLKENHDKAEVTGVIEMWLITNMTPGKAVSDVDLHVSCGRRSTVSGFNRDE